MTQQITRLHILAPSTLFQVQDLAEQMGREEADVVRIAIERLYAVKEREMKYIALTKGSREDLMVDVLRGDDKGQVFTDATTALEIFEEDPRYSMLKSNLIVMPISQALNLGLI